MLLLIFAAVLIYFLYVGVYKPMLYWKDEGVPHVKPVPILGNAWKSTLLMESFIETMKKMYQQFDNERYYGMHILNKPTLCVRDLDLIKQMTIKDFDHFTDHINVIEPDADMVAKNLLNMTGNSWRRMRATLSPAFTSSKMRGMYPLISDCANDVTEYLRGKNLEKIDVELKELCTKFTNDVIASASFGIKCDSLNEEDNEFYTKGKKVTKLEVGAIITLFLYLIIPKVMKALKVRLFPKDVTNFFHSIVLQTKKAREEQHVRRTDMLQLLFDAQKGRLKDEDENATDTQAKYELTDEDITAQALVFFFAGFETVSTGLSFMLLELAIHPEIQEKLQKEIDDTLSTGEITYERILKMPYLDQVLSESLRKWPPVFQTDRTCTKDYTIPAVREGERPLTLKKGSSIIIPIDAIHHDPKYFPDPDRFNPDRFSEENKPSIVPGSYMPFGVGPRNCIGSRFALLEIKIVVVSLLAKFSMVPTEKTKLPIVLSPRYSSPAPKGGFWVGFEPRKVTAL